MDKYYYEDKYVIDELTRIKLQNSFKKVLKLDELCLYKNPFRLENIYYTDIFSNSMLIKTTKLSNKQTFVFYIDRKDDSSKVTSSSIELSNEEFNLWVFKHFLPYRLDNTYINHINNMISNLNLKPYIYTSFERLSYYSKEDSNISVYIDSNVRYKDDDFKFNQYGGKLLIPLDKHILTIRYNSSIPSYIKEILEESNTTRINNDSNPQIIPSMVEFAFV